MKFRVPLLPSHCSLPARIRARRRGLRASGTEEEPHSLASKTNPKRGPTFSGKQEGETGRTPRLVKIRTAQIEAALRTTQLAALLLQFARAIGAVSRTIGSRWHFCQRVLGLMACTRRSFQHHRKRWSVFHSATKLCPGGHLRLRLKDCCSSNPQWHAMRPSAATPPGIFHGR